MYILLSLEEEAENSGEPCLMHGFLPLSELQWNTLTAEGKGASFDQRGQKFGGGSEVKEKPAKEQKERESHCNNRRKTIPHCAHLNRSQEALNETETRDNGQNTVNPDKS